MGFLITLSAVLLCLPVSSFAATYYAAKTGNNAYSCAQAQSPGTSKLTIQAAVNCATAPGDVVIVRTGTYTESWSVSASGVLGNPIVIQAAVGETVTLNNPSSDGTSLNTMLNIIDKSYVRIQGFIFSSNRTRRVIQMWNSGTKDGAPMRGIEILNNTFFDNGVVTTGDYSAVINSDNLGQGANVPAAPVNLIQGNTFTNNYGSAMVINNSNDWRVVGNTGTGQKCSISAGNGGMCQANYVLYGSDTGRHIIEQNHFGLFNTSVTSNVDLAAVRGDSGCFDSTIQNNTFHDVLWGQTHNSSQNAYGIFLESRCHRNTIKNNLIYQTSRSCISIGHPATGMADDVILDGNVCYRSNFYGLDLHHARRVTVRNNIVMDAQAQGGTSILVGDTTVANGPNTFRNNLYFRSGVSVLFRWGGVHFDGANAHLSSWTSLSGETGALNTNPLFVSPTSDFHLQSGSPAIGAGFGGVHMGIYPTSIGSSAPVAPSNLSIVAGP